MSTVRLSVLSAIFNTECTRESVMIEYVNYSMTETSPRLFIYGLRPVVQ